MRGVKGCIFVAAVSVLRGNCAPVLPAVPTPLSRAILHYAQVADVAVTQAHFISISWSSVIVVDGMPHRVNKLPLFFGHGTKLHYTCSETKALNV